MSEIVLTGYGDRAHDAAVQARARRLESMGEASRRTDRSGVPLRRIVERVYTSNLRDAPAAIVRRNAWRVLGALAPGAVISARSAAAARPVDWGDGPDRTSWVFLTGGYRRNLSLPGLEARMQDGPGPLRGDIPLMGLHLASPARHCLENLGPSRARGGPSRTTGRAAGETYLSEQCRVAGEDGLRALRDHARDICADLGGTVRFAELDGIVGALLRTRDAGILVTARGRSLAAGLPYDPACMERVAALHAHLASRPMPRRADPGAGRPAAANAAFLEAYFSNFIEGTRFTVGEARDIVRAGRIPDGRLADALDVLNTHAQVTGLDASARMPRDAARFVEGLRERHARLMAHRPEVRPGAFKERPNRAGNTVFVAPDLVEGTLRAGHELLEALDDPFARAVLLHYLIVDVHPWNDGNGRLARIAMGCELSAGGLARAIVPTVFRDDYVGGQRAMSKRSDCGANFRAIDRAQAVAASIAQDDLDACIGLWASTMAFVEAGRNARLEDPDASSGIAWRDGVPAPEAYWEQEDAPDPLGFAP